MMKLRPQAICLGFLGCALLLAGAESSKETKPLTENKLIKRMFESASNHRTRSGLAKHELDEKLCKQAQNWANNMANRNAMYHGGGEQVIGRGYATPEACVQGWIYSPGHRAWVLSRTAKCGFGAQRSWSGQWYYAGVFR